MTFAKNLSNVSGDVSGNGRRRDHPQSIELEKPFRPVVVSRCEVAGARRSKPRKSWPIFKQTPAALQATGERRTTGARLGFRSSLDWWQSRRPLYSGEAAVRNPQILGFPAQIRSIPAIAVAVGRVVDGAGTARPRPSKPDRSGDLPWPESGSRPVALFQLGFRFPASSGRNLGKSLTRKSVPFSKGYPKM